MLRGLFIELRMVLTTNFGRWATLVYQGAQTTQTRINSRPYWINPGSANFGSCDYRICLERGSRSHWIINLSTKHESSIQNLSEKSNINKIGPVTRELESIYHPNVTRSKFVIYASNRKNHQNCIRYFPITESYYDLPKPVVLNPPRSHRMKIFNTTGTVLKTDVFLKISL